MADELTLSIAGSFAKSLRSANTDGMRLTALEIDVAGTDFVRLTQTIGTTIEALDLGDITTPGYIFLKNRETYDVNKYVTIRAGSGGTAVAKLHGGDGAVFRLATTTPYAIATMDSGTSMEIEFFLVEN